MEYCSRTLEEIRANGCHLIDEGSYTNIVGAVRKTFAAYKEIVANFFTDKADEIHFIYTSIKENSYPYNSVETTDCNAARHNYNEYLEGFREYINRLMDLKAGDEVDHSKLAESLNSVKTRDSDFIQGLLNSDSNPKERTNINGAMKNVEVLIDVYNQMDGICDNLAQYTIRLDPVDPAYKNEMISGIVLMAKSIMHFHYIIICEILKCYHDIHNSIQVRTSVHGEQKVEEYQIF